MDRLCEGRVVVVTGAGGGIGRAYAVEFARHGAAVVVNDFGVDRNGRPLTSNPADAVVSEITSSGGIAISNCEDVANFDGAQKVVDVAVATYGRLDVLVNNAGILRDRMLSNMTIEEWDEVMRVHLRGTFAPTRSAISHWRARSKESDRSVVGRLINTSSASGLFGNPGQANYAAAKAGIAAFTLVASKELERYGVTANAVYPTAFTRMTSDVLGREDGSDSTMRDDLVPAHFAPFVAWLGSVRSEGITGRVFGLRGRRIVVAEGWSAGPERYTASEWTPEELDRVIPELLADAKPNSGVDGQRVPMQSD